MSTMAMGAAGPERSSLGMSILRGNAIEDPRSLERGPTRLDFSAMRSLRVPIGVPMRLLVEFVA